jgi:uncharacterized protein (DUF3084 family)
MSCPNCTCEKCRIGGLIKENEKLYYEQAKLSDENRKLRNEVERLTREREQLIARCEAMTISFERLRCLERLAAADGRLAAV